MANIYRKTGVTPKHTPQSQPMPGREKEMVQNNAGGYVFQTGDWMQLERFLVLGTEGGTYYLSEHDHTINNYEVILRCLKEDYKRTVDMIKDVSVSGRAMKQDQAIFALAVASSTGLPEVTGYALKQLNAICRTGSHLFMFVDFINERRSWGRALRKAVANWYLMKRPDKVAFQMAKYQNRNGWSHSDVLRSAHAAAISPAHQSMFAWATGKSYTQDHISGTMIDALEQMKQAKSVDTVVDLIKQFNAPWEIVPTQFRENKEVWEAMLPSMGFTALIRNLANMTRYGVFDTRANVNIAIERLSDEEALKRARVHPLNILVGQLTYAQGHGVRGSNTWTPHRDISHFLENAFYTSFHFAPSTGKRILYALDLSGSMTWEKIINGLLLPIQVEACMAMALREAEENSAVMGFSTNMIDLQKYIRPGAKLENVVNDIYHVGGGGTDCAQPMQYATKKNLLFDMFCLFTDNETWAGAMSVPEALRDYRNKSGIHDAKLCVVGMTSTGFTIADPKDVNMLDVVGCSADLPALIQNFAGGKKEEVETTED